jgi:uncharacterized protein YraI
VPRAAKITVGGNGQTHTIGCNDSYVTVSGNSNTITATGHCAAVTVSGSGNHVSLERADTIRASGVGNVVTYQSGSPHVSKAGLSNTVDQG